METTRTKKTGGARRVAAFRPVVPLAWLISSLLAAAAAAADQPPHIVWIVADDQAWTDYGFMGHPQVETPHLDQLARRSAVFTRGYVPTALCRPSLATLITGKYAHQHGITGNDPAPIPDAGPENDSRDGAKAADDAQRRAALIAKLDKQETLPRLLARRGYLSFQSGKWWEGSFARGGFTHGMTRGFPHPGGRHGDAGLEIGRAGLQPAFEFMDTALANEQPFFLWYAPFLPHTPHNPPARLLEKYKDKGITSDHVARYYAMIEWFDATCGQLLEYLDQRQITPQTLIVYVGDNGWIQDPNRPGFAPRSKQSPNEGGVRQPIMFCWPGQIPPGDRGQQLCSSVDILPTSLAAAGAAPPADLPGDNLLPSLRSGKPVRRREVLGEGFAHDVAELDNPQASLLYRWIIEDRWKLLLTYDGRLGRYASHHSQAERRPQLFDLLHDPHEQTNLADAHPDRVARLTEKIAAWWPVTQRRVETASATPPAEEDDEQRDSLAPRSPQAPPWLRLEGVSVTPHRQSPEMRYRRATNTSLGVRMELFLRNVSEVEQQVSAVLAPRFRGRSADELVAAGAWAWHDTPEAWPASRIVLPAGAMTVWKFNSRREAWGIGTRFDLEAAAGADGAPACQADVPIDMPPAWLSAVTFLGDANQLEPQRMVLHVANASSGRLQLIGCRLWLPRDNATWQVLLPGPVVELKRTFPEDGTIPGGEKGGAVVTYDRLPLSYTAVELQCRDDTGRMLSLWAHLRIKRERFDISGGWVATTMGNRSSLQYEPFLKTLKRLHVNTAHIAEVPGYTDQDGVNGLYTRYPLKYFAKLQPFTNYDTDEVLPRVHAVEFLGEPQYGGGRPVPPMEVWRQLAPYQTTRLATTVTHSEERIWRYYAGLSDYPHYDAYRVSAPAADAWAQYDRWDGKRVRWGAPLETIGDLSRSLRELNRPGPTAYWSQGPHAEWDVYGGRQRTSPTRDELRVQAYHALASRITSLYWFNLSLPSLVKYPDLLEELGRVGRETRMLATYYLEGDAYDYQRVRRDDRLDWDLAVLATPDAALLFALDLDYAPDVEAKLFRFGEPRAARFWFRLPPHLRQPQELFRIDADGTHDVPYTVAEGRVAIDDRVSRAAVYVCSTLPGTREMLERRRRQLVELEQSVAFDPAGKDEDLQQLQSFLEARQP